VNSFSIKNLGAGSFDSPLIAKYPSRRAAFVSDHTRVLFNPLIEGPGGGSLEPDVAFEQAGPREKLFFDPGKTRAAVVTCGGLCPGLNDVIRAVVMESYYHYGVKSILGIRFGYNGLNPESGYAPVDLNPDIVADIHRDGGTILGSSRGGTDDMEALVSRIAEMGIDILYTLGGDGTLHGANRIAAIAGERGMKLSVIGIPKTIDNDISYIQKSFGFETAFSKAVEAIASAHVEAKGAPNGVGLVKLMGRHSGFIAANATLAMNDVNFVLVPEVSFDLDGPGGFLAELEERLSRRHHAGVCVAEGAGQELLKRNAGKERKDASGNVVLDDIGIFLKDRISRHFRDRGMSINLKYIDPSYMIRSAPANPNDSVFCGLLGQYAVHAGMAGKSDMIVGIWNNIYTHVPIELAISTRKRINPDSRFWYNVLEATGQKAVMRN
jgi:6-phosphofructokinase 1